VIVIETMQQKDNDPLAILAMNGYTCVEKNHNSLCTRQGFSPTQMRDEDYLEMRKVIYPGATGPCTKDNGCLLTK
jgi:hypothetical protein